MDKPEMREGAPHHGNASSEQMVGSTKTNLYKPT